MDKNTNEAFENLLVKNVELYTHGILTQYGVSEEQSLEIVSKLTGLPKEKLQEIKAKRNDALSQNFGAMFDDTAAVLGADVKTR